MYDGRPGSSDVAIGARRHLLSGTAVRRMIVVVGASSPALLTLVGAAGAHAGRSARFTNGRGPQAMRSVRQHRAKASASTPGGGIHVSVNANATKLSVPGDGTLHELVETPCPRLVPGKSGSGPVTNRDASSMIARAQFQIESIRPVAPTFAYAQINFRRKSDDKIVSNLGTWGIGSSLLGSVNYLQTYSFDWLYVPYNDIPTPPIEVGNCSAYNISLDLGLNKGAGGVVISPSIIELFAGDFYSPGTTQIGNSPSPGPIGSL